MAELPKKRQERTKVYEVAPRLLGQLRTPQSEPEVKQVVARPLDGSVDTERYSKLEQLADGLKDINPKISKVLAAREETAALQGEERRYGWRYSKTS